MNTYSGHTETGNSNGIREWIFFFTFSVCFLSKFIWVLTAGTWVFFNIKRILNSKKVIDYYILNGLIRIWSLKQWDYWLSRWHHKSDGLAIQDLDFIYFHSPQEKSSYIEIKPKVCSN